MSIDVDASQSLEDNTRSERPSDAVSPSVFAAVEKRKMEDRRTKVLEIVRAMKILCGRIETIIHDHLKISIGICAMGTKNFQETAQDRVRRVTSSQEFLDLFTSDQEKFVRHIITGNETWIYPWYPESK